MTTDEPLLPNCLRRCEWFAVIAIGFVIVSLHLFFLASAGGLWRDEAGFVHLATLSTWNQLWQMLSHDHSPILVPAVIRTWHALGLGKTDFEVRMLGFCLGILLPVSLWVTAWKMRRGIPLLALLLVGINAFAIQAGDSLRAYGLGSALGVLSLAMIYQAANKMSLASFVWATLAAVAAVQCLYQNAVFVFAACCGGMVLCWNQQRRHDGFLILVVGLIAAATLIPYAGPLLHSQDWWILEKSGFKISIGFRNLAVLLGFPWFWFGFAWFGLGGFAVYVIIRALKSASQPANAPILFSGIALIIGIAGFFGFLKLSNLPTQPWYYLPLMTFGAACLDAVLTDCIRWGRFILCMLTIFIGGVAFWRGLPIVECRQTNVDFIAAQLAQEASPDDYIIVHPWFCGVSFNRYYQGSAPWTTIPPLEDYGIHRYDLFKLRMQADHPNQETIDKLSDTLRSGHRVWVVGWLNVSTNPPPTLKPAPNGSQGWLDEGYSQIWGMQVGHVIAMHAEKAATIANPVTVSVNPFENLPFMVFSGWTTARESNNSTPAPK